MLVGGRAVLDKDLKNLEVAVEKYNDYVKKTEAQPEPEAEPEPEPEPEPEVRTVKIDELIFDLIEKANEEPALSLILETYKSVDLKFKKENVDVLIEEGYFPPYAGEMSGGVKTSDSPTPKKPLIKKTKGFRTERKEPIYRASIKLSEGQIAELEKSDFLASQSANTFFKIMFPFISVGKFGQLRRARHAWDQPNADLQCKIVLGSNANKTCYICGVDFVNVPEQLRRVCEHILPPLQAAMFLKLYKKGDDPTQKELQLEYAWAHTCCNEIKSDNSFLALERFSDEVRFKRNYIYIQVLLNNILKPEGLCKNVIQPANVDSWKQIRTEDINEKVDAIVEHIRSKGTGRATLLAAFQNCVRDENLTDLFLKMLKRYATIKGMMIVNEQLLEDIGNINEVLKRMIGGGKRTRRNLRLKN